MSSFKNPQPAESLSSPQQVSQVKISPNTTTTSLILELKTPSKLLTNTESHVPRNVNSKKTEPHVHTSRLESEQTEVKLKSGSRILQAEQNETETRKYHKLLGSTEIKAAGTLNCHNDQHGSPHTENFEAVFMKKSPYSQKTDIKKNLAIIENPQGTSTSKKRRTQVFERTLMYVPNKKLKKDVYFSQDALEVFDKLQNQNIKFRLFKDRDFGYSKLIQTTVRASKVDDDCPTDSEQMELAKKHVQKQLHQALELQDYIHSQSPSFYVSSKFASNESTSRGASSYVPNSSHTSIDTLSASNETEDVTYSPEEIKKVVKRLSYSEVEETDSQEKRQSMSRSP